MAATGKLAYAPVADSASLNVVDDCGMTHLKTGKEPGHDIFA